MYDIAAMSTNQEMPDWAKKWFTDYVIAVAEPEKVENATSEALAIAQSISRIDSFGGSSF